MMKIVSIAMNPSIDKSSSVERVIAERKLYCKPPRQEPGGGGVNISRAIKKLGGESMLLYPAGGVSGHLLKDILEQEGVSQQPLYYDGMTRENLVVLDESSGQQFRFGMPGSSLNRADWERCLYEMSNLVPKPDYIVASGSLPPGVPSDFYARIGYIGKDMGAKVIVDTSGEALRLAIEEGVYLIKPNVREFREFAGDEIKEESQIKDAAKMIVEKGYCEAVVISLGAGGALMVSKDITEHILPPTVPVISKVGAGDSMVAGIVLSLAGDMSLLDAVRFGVASGAAAVMTPGTELCRKDDAERLYKEVVSVSLAR